MMDKKEMRKLATVYTIKYSNENDLPSRYRKGDNSQTDKPRKGMKNSKVEKKFQNNINGYIDTFTKMFELIDDQEQVVRFITLVPKVIQGTTRVSDNEDFVRFLDYLIQRRDIDKCEDFELGKICILQSLFTQKVEEAIKTN